MRVRKKVKEYKVMNAEDRRIEAGEELREEQIIKEYKSRIKNPMTAIRSHCVECMGGQPKGVSDCTIPDCSLYPFRMGNNPFHTRRNKK